MDNLTKEERSVQMSKIRSKNTKVEMIVRRLVFSFGYRYRLHCKDLPGKPDLVFKSRRKTIFINGCFWHGHDCRLGRIPKSHVQFWVDKINYNKNRDGSNLEKLAKLGWESLVIWECQLKNIEELEINIKSFLG